MANHVEHHTKFWSNHGGGGTINRLAKQKYAGVHRDEIPPEVFTGVARLSKQARQDNLGKDRDDIDPMSFPDGAPRRQKQARQANLGKDRDDIDPMSFPDGASRRQKQDRQNNLGECYLDRTSHEKHTSNAYAAANAKVESLAHDGYSVGISNRLGDTTTAYSVRDAYHFLWENANDVDGRTGAFIANKNIFLAFDRCLQNMRKGGNEKWSIASGMKICFGKKKLDGSLPSFGPYLEGGGVLHACSSCEKTYARKSELTRHKKDKGH